MRKSPKTRRRISARSAILHIRSKLLLSGAAFHRKNADLGSTFAFAERPVCSKVCSRYDCQEHLGSGEQLACRMLTFTDTDQRVLPPPFFFPPFLWKVKTAEGVLALCLESSSGRDAMLAALCFSDHLNNFLAGYRHCRRLGK